MRRVARDDDLQPHLQHEWERAQSGAGQVYLMEMGCLLCCFQNCVAAKRTPTALSIAAQPPLNGPPRPVLKQPQRGGTNMRGAGNRVNTVRGRKCPMM